MYKNKNLPVEERVRDLLSKMTLEEKLAQLCSDLPQAIAEAAGNGFENPGESYSFGLGRITQYSIAGLQSPADIAGLSNAIQRFFVEKTRLGIPVIFQSESLSGYPAAGGTMFPAMINVASTFNPELAEKMGGIISEECKAVGIRQALSPVLDISRDPRWGRVYETFGEDQYLSSQMGIAYVRGLQKNKHDGVLATAKHFLGYSETQAGLNAAATRVGDRELYEVFATPFEAAMKEADLASVMTSYSEIDGIPCGANKKIARGLLRETMNFKGVVVSDGGAVWKLFNTYGIAKDYPEAGLLALKGGIDTEMPVGNAFRKLGEYIESGELDISLVDEAVARVLTSKFELGLFENPYIDADRAEGLMSDDDRLQLSGEITEQSIILLKNEDNVLPLKPELKAAVIGPHGGTVRPGVSGYTAIAYFEMLQGLKAGKDKETTFHGMMDEKQKSKAENKKSDFQSVFEQTDTGRFLDEEGIERLIRDNYHARTLVEELGSRMSTSHAGGCDILGEDTGGFEEAVALANKSELVIMTLGGNCGWINCTGGEGKDRSSLSLPGVQQQLLNEVAKTGKDIVLILYGPGQYAPEIARNVKAVVNAWLPGAYGGAALARLLCGEASPSGKLPVTMPRNVGQVPIFYNHKTGSGYKQVMESAGINSIEIFGGGYVDADNTPLFPFGHGLSYTSFEITDAALEGTEVTTQGVIALSCTVKNTGGMAGSEVVQLYYRDCEAHVTRPVKQLAGFKRVSLQPQESVRLSFELDTAQLGFYNEEMKFVVEPGNIEVMLGTSSEAVAFQQRIMLTGNTRELMGKRSYTCKVRSN